VRTTIAGVLLAAGEGSRFGGPKALIELDGQTLAERGVGLLRAGGADPILVVTGAVPLSVPGAYTVHNPDWRTGMGSSLGAALNALAGRDHLTTDPAGIVDAGTDPAGTVDAGTDPAGTVDAGTDPAGTVDAGTDPAGTVDAGTDPAGTVDGGTGDVGAAVVALADQPLVGPESVARLIAAYRGGASVAVAAYDGRPRNPVLLAREHWPEVIATATGDTGARAFLRARPDLVTLIECGDTGRPDDIDTPADLARIIGTLPGP
jgi:CTP:molybdopterin cytidylyltransferase MocA